MRPLPFSSSTRPFRKTPFEGVTSCLEEGFEDAVKEVVLFEENPARFWRFVCPIPFTALPPGRRTPVPRHCGQRHGGSHRRAGATRAFYLRRAW